MLEMVTQLKSFLEAQMPSAAALCVMVGLGAVAIFIVVKLLDILFNLIKIVVVAGLAVGLIYILLRS